MRPSGTGRDRPSASTASGRPGRLAGGAAAPSGAGPASSTSRPSAASRPGVPVRSSSKTAATSNAPSSSSTSAPPPAAAPSAGSSAAAPSSGRTFTLADLATKENKSRLTAIKGKVYDLSSFKHPGGPFTIGSIKGKDGTREFMAKHGEKNLRKVRCVGVLVR